MKFQSVRGRLDHRRCASTSSPTTPAPTSATCGRPPARSSAEVTFTNETASGWQQAALPEPVQITKDTTYITSYYAAAGRFGFSPGYFGSGDQPRPAARAE